MTYECNADDEGELDGKRADLLSRLESFNALSTKVSDRDSFDDDKYVKEGFHAPATWVFVQVRLRWL